MARGSRHRAHGTQEVHDLLKALDNLVAMTGNTPKAIEARQTKANELARRAMQHAASGVNIREAVKRFIIELEARKDIPPKMLYSVFSQFASSDQSIATMIAGLLANRCSDLDQTVRRSSLQQLTSLRIPSLVDVMLSPLEKALSDGSPAVRAAAVLAVLKVATLTDADVDLAPFWAKVDAMLHSDDSTEVLHACVAVKLQREDEAAMVRDAELVEDLVVRLMDFEPHQRAAVLALAKRFEPGEAATTIFGHPAPGVPRVAAFMDAVEPCLFSVDSATTLAAVDALLCWAKSTGNEYWYSQALNRVKKPLYALCRSADPEVAWVALCHVALLVQQAPYAFAEDYAQFFLRHSDVPYVKQQKIAVLKYLATEDNQLVLVSELMEYTKDREAHTSRAAVRALAHIVLTVESVGLIESLMDLLGSGDCNVVSETVLMLKDIIRRYPDVVQPYAATLQGLPVVDLQTNDATAAYFWIRAEMEVQSVPDADGVEPAAYVFEEYADKWDALSAVSKTELLYAAARVALVRAAMAAPVLRKVLLRALKDADVAVSDAGRLIHSAFGSGLDVARALLSGPTTATLAADETSDAALQELVGEFNTLAVIYERPARTFVDRGAHGLREVPADQPEPTAEETVMDASYEAQLLDFSADDGGADGGVDGGDAAADPLAGLSDLDALTGAPPLAPGVPAATFDPTSTMNKDVFRQQWAELEGSTGNAAGRVPASAGQLAALVAPHPKPFAGLHAVLAGYNIKVFAEGPQGGFMFAKRMGDGPPVFIQYGLEGVGAVAGALFATVRSTDAFASQAVVGLWHSDVAAYVNSLPH